MVVTEVSPVTPQGDPAAKLSGRPLPLLPGVKGLARFSDDSRHRYELWRIRRADPNEPFALFIGLNPSIGAPDIDDHTLRRIQAFALREGFENVAICNAFAIRGTDPNVLKRVPDPVGPDNDRTLADFRARAALTVAAWGDGGALHGRDAELRRLLDDARPIWCLGLTKSGFPRHPLRLRGDTPLIPYAHGEPSHAP